ncbi:CoA transferase [Paenalcaligenes niemegkensis]|uniref:CaiB/BaiF CoA transferase family protein n=1 Tax=Paenalcaligenes niemegkensis TaxID=2895469 RepID=UPI001EE811E5|nr:CoA transferase [Paenalcaligenes niemegkensis]MCQ9615446.1 CoA transferase [Paenalcaligenes niemegkensis]
MKDASVVKISDQAEAPWLRLPVRDVGDGFQLLAGYTILDLTTSVAGPYGTMLLSDFGADVIKVERPNGDDARRWGPPFLNGHSLWFTAVNRNKKSVVIDMTGDEGRSQFRELLLQVDVLFCNQPLDIQRKLGIDYETLKTIKEDLIFVAITGFGLDGERAELTCYDLIAEGYSGVMDLTGAADSAPQKIGAPAADMLAGQDAAMATVVALLNHQRSGKGAKIDVSLAESMARFLTCRISSYLGSGEVPTRSGGTDSVIAIYQSFNTADEPLNLGLGSDAIWKRFWHAVGEPDYAERPEFRSNADRRLRRGEIVADIQRILLDRKRGQWLDVFAEARIPAGPLNRVDEAAHDQAFQQRGLFFTLKDGEQLLPQVGLGIRIDGESSTPRSAPPTLGQHTEDILSALHRSKAGASSR